MGGAVLFSRQDADCPTYPDCTCEDWGMSCDLETYDWYQCDDTDIAGSYDCNPPASGTGTGIGTASTTSLPAGGSGTSNPSATGSAPTASIGCSNPSLEDGDGLCTCTQGSFTTTITPAGGAGNACPTTLTGVPPQTGIPPTSTTAAATSTAFATAFGCSNPSLEDGDGICTCTQGTVTSTITPAGGPGNACPTAMPPASTTSPPSTTGPPPGDCPNNGVDQNAPGCPTSTAATSFSCGVASNVGVATYNPATWCGCNDGKSYPTLSAGSAPCAYATAPAASAAIHPSAIPPKMTSTPHRHPLRKSFSQPQPHTGTPIWTQIAPAARTLVPKSSAATATTPSSNSSRPQEHRTRRAVIRMMWVDGRPSREEGVSASMGTSAVPAMRLWIRI